MNRWDNITKMDLKEVGGGGTDWICSGSAQGQVLLNAVMNLWVP